MVWKLSRLVLLVCVCARPGVLQAGEAGRPIRLEVDADGVQRGALILDSHAYLPHDLLIRAGRPVELVLTNVALITPHNFILKAPEAGLDVNQDVGAGESVTVRFTSRKPGVYTFFCDKKLLFFPSHREKGMEGRLEVRE